MKELLTILDRVPEFGGLLNALDAGGCPVAVSGLAAVHRAHFAAGIRARTGRPVVLVCAAANGAPRLPADPPAPTRGAGAAPPKKKAGGERNPPPRRCCVSC